MTTSKKEYYYSSLSCISLPSLPTITEETSKPKNNNNNNNNKKIKHLYAIFDFETFVLDSIEATENEILSKRKINPDLAITNMAVQEYINKRINTTITLIVIPSRIIKKLKTTRIPCLAKKKSIYITKYKNNKDNEFYIKLSTIKPSKPLKQDNNNTSNDNRIKCAFNGMVFAIIFSTFPSSKRFIINGVYYHGHGSPIYTPNFDGREKDLRACKPYDIFLPDHQNAIKTLKPFKRKRAKSDSNSIAIIKNEQNKRSRSRSKSRSKPKPKLKSKLKSKSKSKTKSKLSSRSKSPSNKSPSNKSPSNKSPSNKPKKKKINRQRGKSDSLSYLTKKISQNQGKRKTLKQKKVMRKVKIRVCGDGLDSIKPKLNNSTSINSVLSVSLSPIKESKLY